MELKADSSQNQSHRVYPPFHADPKEIFDYPKNKLTALDMIGMHENIPGIPNKPSKSAWGRVSEFVLNPAKMDNNLWMFIDIIDEV